MIKTKLDYDDLCLLEVIEDPIFCAEFLRTTRDASPNKSVWLTKPFEYRWYQRDIITDRSEYVVLTGGRSIGKCQPRNARIYTDHGYRSVNVLIRKKCFSVYCVDDNGNVVKRRAVMAFDKYATVYKLRTKSGYEIFASGNHPIHTDRGYVPLEDLTLEDLVTVTTHLPYDNTQSLLRPEELRYIGYIFLSVNIRPDGAGFTPRFKQIRNEIRKLAEMLNIVYTEGLDGRIYLRKKPGYGKHPIAVMLSEIQMASFTRNASYTDPKKIPRILSESFRSECNDNIQIFLEALLAQSAELSMQKVQLACGNTKTASQLQELFLRFGIEMLYDNDGLLYTRDYRAVYRMYTLFDIPGVRVDSIPLPPASFDQSEHFRYDPIESIDVHGKNLQTYAIYVYDTHNYITDNVLVHNSLVLEDKQIVDIINHDVKYPETKEMLLTTANQAQIDPVLSRVISRATTSPLLKESLANRVNKSLGTLDFRFGEVQFIYRARIAGGNKESNIVGLHIPQINIDEGQLYLLGAFTQLMPTLNTWESRKQVFIAGVNG